MNYIINPIWFYIIDVLENLKIIALGMTLVFGCALPVILYIYFEIRDDEDEWHKEIQELKKAMKFSIITLIVSFGVRVFVPSEETCYKMIVASTVTTENVNKAESVIKDSVDYIFEKLGDK